MRLCSGPLSVFSAKAEIALREKGIPFTPRRVEHIRPFLRSAAHELIDAFAARGSCEFVAEFATRTRRSGSAS